MIETVKDVPEMRRLMEMLVVAERERKFVIHFGGVEYGIMACVKSFGKHEDIEPYMDPVFQNNVILSQTERLTMNSRPSNPKYARNKNTLVVGGSGSGKTRFFIKPNLLQMHSSYVLTDPKRAVF